MNLRGVDLNLIPILQSLLREGSVTGTAKSLSMSQPAVSQALGRLRRLFNDPLLVKVGREMQLTARAERLRSLADKSCMSINSMLATEDFDPATVHRKFTIASPDWLSLLIGEELIETLRHRAPNFTVVFVDVSYRLREETIAGTIDLSVIAYLPKLFPGLSFQRGFLDRFVCVASNDHPIANRGQLEWRDVAEYTRLNFNAAPEFKVFPSTADSAAEPVIIGASQLMVMPLLAARAKTVTVVPQTLAKLAAELTPLAITDIAMAPFEHCLVWNPVEDEDPAHRWLRQTVATILSRHAPRKEEG